MESNSASHCRWCTCLQGSTCIGIFWVNLFYLVQLVMIVRSQLVISYQDVGWSKKVGGWKLRTVKALSLNLTLSILEQDHLRGRFQILESLSAKSLILSYFICKFCPSLHTWWQHKEGFGVTKRRPAKQKSTTSSLFVKKQRTRHRNSSQTYMGHCS